MNQKQGKYCLLILRAIKENTQIIYCLSISFLLIFLAIHFQPLPRDTKGLNYIQNLEINVEKI